jgi:hypothetical protein
MTEVFKAQARISSSSFDDGRREYEIRAAHQKAKHFLFDFLYSNRPKIYTVTIADEMKKVSSYLGGYDEIYEISLSVTEARTKEVVMMTAPNFGAMPWRILAPTALDEIKGRIKKYFSGVKK